MKHKEAHEHQIHDCIRRHFHASNTQVNPSQRQSMTGSPPLNMPPLLQLHQSSPTMSNEQLDQQHLLLMQLQGKIYHQISRIVLYLCRMNFSFYRFVSDQPLNLAQPSHSSAKQPSPTQLSSQPNSSQNSTTSSLSNLMLPATTNPGPNNSSTSQGVSSLCTYKRIYYGESIILLNLNQIYCLIDIIISSCQIHK